MRKSLAECDIFQTDTSLANANVFTTPELVGFARSIPQANMPQARVDALVSYLLPKTYLGQPVLIVFLEVLRDNYDGDPDKQAELQGFIDQLNALAA